MASNLQKGRQKQLNAGQSSRQRQVYLARFKPKAGAMRGWPIAGLSACDFYLVLFSVYLFWAQNEPGVRCFGYNPTAVYAGKCSLHQ